MLCKLIQLNVLSKAQTFEKNKLGNLFDFWLFSILVTLIWKKIYSPYSSLIDENCAPSLTFNLVLFQGQIME